MIIFYDIKKDFKEIGKIELGISNPAFFNDKYMIAEDSNDYKIYLINIEEKKKIKEKDYEPRKTFVLKRICDEWMYKLEKDKITKLINVDLVKDNNNDYDIIANNEKSSTIESGTNLITLFDEFFLLCKSNGNIDCYGCF